jgi:hypothetical protein
VGGLLAVRQRPDAQEAEDPGFGLG